MWLFEATEGEVLSNVCRKAIVNFGMARNGLFLAGPRLEVNVVAGRRAEKEATSEMGLNVVIGD